MTNPQQDYFELLESITHPKNIKISNVYFNSATTSYTPGKRYNKEKYQIHDERNIAVNEVIFDLDWTSYKANYQKAKSIIEILENRNIPYFTCATGGKGIHIHVFFDKIKFETEEGKILFKEALSYQLSFKHIRLWIWNMILDEAGIEEKFRKKQVDPKVLQFNYYSGTSHLIRDIGGRKFTKNIEGDWKPQYKTFIPKDQFKVKKTVINSFENVQYPTEIKLMCINENEFISFLKNFISKQTKSNTQKLTNERIKGKYTELDGVLKVREGLNEGFRNSGASVIAIACKIDNLNKSEAYELIDEYVKNCSQSGSSFDTSEGRQWVDWIYSYDKPYWNCQLLKDLDCHDISTCEHCQAQNRDAIEFLGQKTILKQIKEVLDEEIVGEDDTKLLIFLLLLSKDFPSKTGKKGWNIPNDPMSQNVILSSDSASGKSWIIKKILELFGDKNEDYFIISRMSKNAINYYTDINMDGKIIFIEEMQGLDENTSQLRVWMSEGELSFDTVEKVIGEDGIERNAKVEKITQGQPVFVTNQAEGVVEEQLHNRSWVLSLDASASQTSKILKFQDKQHKGKFKIDNVKKRKIKDALKQLKQYHFLTYFADNEAMKIPLTDVRARRDYTKFLTLIRCSAYLHQNQRDKYTDEDGNEFLICDIEDYNIAVQYSADILGSTFSGLTNNEIELINHLKKDNWDDTFTVPDIMRNLGKSQPHWYGMLKQLEDYGYVISEKNLGSATIYSLVQNKTINIIDLPSGKELLTKIIKKWEGEKDRSYKWLTNKLEMTEVVNSVTPEQPLIAKNSVVVNKDNSRELLKNQDYAIEKGCNSDSSLFQSENPEKFIAKVTPELVLNFIKNHKSHLVNITDLMELTKDLDVLEKCLIHLKGKGEIFEPKPSKFVIL